MAVGDSAWLVVGGSVSLRAGKRGAWLRVGAAVSTGRCLAGMLQLVVHGGGWWLVVGGSVTLRAGKMGGDGWEGGCSLNRQVLLMPNLTCLLPKQYVS